MADHISRRFNWNDVLSSTISDVLGLNAEIMEDGAARWEAVAFCLDSTAVMVAVEPDTDEVVISHEAPPVGDGWARIPSLEVAVSQPLGWSWLGINSQGYKDSFTIALGDVVPDALQPRFTLLAEASSLICFDLTPHRV